MSWAWQWEGSRPDMGGSGPVVGVAREGSVSLVRHQVAPAQLTCVFPRAQESW